MEAQANLRFLRMSPRKVRLVIDAVRGLPVEEALVKLEFIKKDAAEPVKKLLLSAVANAEHNLKQKATGLYIKKITADGGPILKRWAPRAFGRSAPIRKRTSHLQIVLAPLAERPQDKKAIAQAAKAARRDARREAWQKKKAARHAARDAKFAELEQTKSVVGAEPEVKEEPKEAAPVVAPETEVKPEVKEETPVEATESVEAVEKEAVEQEKEAPKADAASEEKSESSET